jgi:hypothetical protein
MANNYDYLLKFIIIGDSSTPSFTQVSANHACYYATPKTDSKQIMNPRLGSNSDRGPPPSAISLSKCKSGIQYILQHSGRPVVIQSHHALLLQRVPRPTRRSIAAFLVYDVTKRDSFDNINRWLCEVKNHGHDKVLISLVGNKSDLKDKREVSYE